MSTKNNKESFIQLPSEIIISGYLKGPMSLLFLLLEKYTWFETNQVNKKYKKSELAKNLRVPVRQIFRYFDFLRKEKLLFKLHPDEKFEYINPKYCCKCSQEKRNEMINIYLNRKGIIINQNESIPKPLSLNFSKVKSADILKQDEELEEIFNPKSTSENSFGKINNPLELEECPW